MANNIFTGIQDFLSGGKLDEASNYLKGSIGVYDNITVPDMLKFIPELQKQVQVGSVSPASYQAVMAQLQGSLSPASYQAVLATMSGQMTPAQAEAVLQQDSAFSTVRGDQTSIDAQRRGILQLEEIARRGGLTEADRAQLQAVMNQTNAEAARNRQAQIQQMQMQGNAGTGTELAARLAGGQQMANANAMAGAQTAQAAQARALQALQASIGASANLNTQQFDQAAKRAQAMDAVNQFNAAARNQIAMQNAQMQQQASQANFNAMNQFALANQAAMNQAAQQNTANQQQAGLALFNTANQIGIQNAQAANTANATNAQLARQADLANFNMANTIAGTNVGIANQQAMMPYNAAQANYTNQLNLANQQSAAARSAGATLGNMAQTAMNNTGGGLAGIWQSMGGGPGMTKAASDVIGLISKGYQFLNGVWKDIQGNTAQGPDPNTIDWGNQSWTGGVDWGNQSWTGGVDMSNPYGGGYDFSGIFDYGQDPGYDFSGTFGDSGGWDLNWTWGDDGLSDERVKTGKRELSDDDVDKVLAHMTGYKYRYKGDKSNPEQTGVMAQDAEKAGLSVVDTPAGKVLQGQNNMGQALAILANQNERIKRLEGKK